jgi:hypothetical protein
MRTVEAILGSFDFNPLTITERKHTKETIEKMRLVKLGKRHSPETIEKIRLANKGSKNPMYGRPSAWLGRHHSDETKLKIR